MTLRWDCALTVPLTSFFSASMARSGLSIFADLGEELVGQEADVGAFQPGSLHNVHDLGRHHGPADQLLDRQFSLRGALLSLARNALDQRNADRLEEAYLFEDRTRFVAGRSQCVSSSLGGWPRRFGWVSRRVPGGGAGGSRSACCRMR